MCRFALYIFFITLRIFQLSLAIDIEDILFMDIDDVPTINAEGIQINETRFDVPQKMSNTPAKEETLRISLWPMNPITKKYEIPLDFQNITDQTKYRIFFVTGYIERATEIYFKKASPSDTVYVKITEDADKPCYSSMGKPCGNEVTSMNLHPRHCNTFRIVLRSFFHLLGFFHEYERMTRATYRFERTSDSIIELYTVNNDELMYSRSSKGNIKMNNNTTPFNISNIRSTFFTRCDWSLLLTLYPGKNVPPSCQVNFIPSVLKPSTELENYYGQRVPEQTCDYYNEFLVDTSLCIPIQNTFYPSLTAELGYIAYETPLRMSNDSLFSIPTGKQNESLPSTTRDPNEILPPPTAMAIATDFVFLDSIPYETPAPMKPIVVVFYLTGQVCSEILKNMVPIGSVGTCLSNIETYCNTQKTHDQLHEWVTENYQLCDRETTLA